MEYVAVIKRSDGELLHWKYVKKTKVNGKWRYYYDTESLKDDLGFDERQRLKDKQDELKDAIAKEKQSKSDMLDQAIRVEYNSYSPSVVKTYDDLVAKNEHDSAVVDDAQKAVKNFIDEYAKTPIGKIENLVDSGLEFMAKLSGVNILKKGVNELKDVISEHKDAKRRTEIEKDAFADYARYKKVVAKNQKLARNKAEERETKTIQKQLVIDAVRKKQRIKDQRMARKRAEEKEEETYARLKAAKINRLSNKI